MKTKDNIVYYITTDNAFDQIYYLAWQKPAWDQSGYFWTTSLEVFRQCLPINIEEHRFVFDSEEDAIKFIKDWKIHYKCYIVAWNLHGRSLPKENSEYNKFYHPGIAIEVTI